MLYCTKCGVRIDEDDEFCPECGTPVKERLKTSKIRALREKALGNITYKAIMTVLYSIYALLLFIILASGEFQRAPSLFHAFLPFLPFFLFLILAIVFDKRKEKALSRLKTLRELKIWHEIKARSSRNVMIIYFIFGFLFLLAFIGTCSAAGESHPVYEGPPREAILISFLISSAYFGLSIRNHEDRKKQLSRLEQM